MSFKTSSAPCRSSAIFCKKDFKIKALQDIKRIHFVGIGGIGLSGLAKYASGLGIGVTGSDLKATAITQELVQMGIDVNAPHDKNAIANQDLIVHTSIAKSDNPELIHAQSLGIPTLSRKDFLPLLLGERKVYSVCGAHGKSTTTAMLGAIFDEASSIIGAQCKRINSNMHLGSDTIIFEADESDQSFLNSNPHMAIVTNAEPEHMENYNYDEAWFYECYTQFIQNAQVAIVNAQDEFLGQLQGDHICKLYPSRDITGIVHKLIDGEPFTQFQFRDWGIFEVWGLGQHTASNAALAILAASQTMDLPTIKAKLKTFRGIKKRFDILQNTPTFTLIDDYGHHPTEIKATLEALGEYKRLQKMTQKSITTIWQPHKYSRTLDNLEAFQACFEGTDRLIVLPVWRAGEPHQEIDFEGLFGHCNLTFAKGICTHANRIELIGEHGVDEVIEQGFVIGFGAGDITYQLRGM